MKKLVGYIFSILGIALILLNLNFVSYDIKILGNIPKYLITVVGLVLIVVSVILLKENKTVSANKSDTPRELPIYEGENIVGFRRQQSTSKKIKKGKR